MCYYIRKAASFCAQSARSGLLLYSAAEITSSALELSKYSFKAASIVGIGTVALAIIIKTGLSVQFQEMGWQESTARSITEYSIAVILSTTYSGSLLHLAGLTASVATGILVAFMIPIGVTGIACGIFLEVEAVHNLLNPLYDPSWRTIFNHLPGSGARNMNL